jgi:hypothetical protein
LQVAPARISRLAPDATSPSVPGRPTAETVLVTFGQFDRHLNFDPDRHRRMPASGDGSGTWSEITVRTVKTDRLLG